MTDPCASHGHERTEMEKKEREKKRKEMDKKSREAHIVQGVTERHGDTLLTDVTLKPFQHYYQLQQQQ